MLKNDRDKYLEFYKDYGLNLKYGLYENYGEKKDKLKDLILLRSFNEDKLVSFAEYKEKMPEGQKAIYYAVAKDKDSAAKLPQMEMVKSKGYDVLILSDDVDEFMINVLAEYDELKFKSINKDDLELLDEDEAKKIDEMKEEKKDLLASIKEAIPSAKDVILSKRLVDAACCVSSTGEITFEMERVLKSQNRDVKADRVFEINPNHEVFKKLEEAYNTDKDYANKLVNILYNEALLQEGILPDDPKAFASDITSLILK